MKTEAQQRAHKKYYSKPEVKASQNEWKKRYTKKNHYFKEIYKILKSANKRKLISDTYMIELQYERDKLIEKEDFEELEKQLKFYQHTYRLK